MGLAYYIVGEMAVDDFDTFVDGKALGHTDEDALETLCLSLEVVPLLDFLSQDPEDLRDMFEAEHDEDEEDVAPGDYPDEEWFSAVDGLATVRALIAHLAEHPDELPADGFDADAVLEDLKAFERILVRFDDEGIRWHLAVDY